MDICPFPANEQIKVGLVGTGYAAKARAETLQRDGRTQLVAVVGHTDEKTQEFSQTYQAAALSSWQQLVEREDLDLIIVCTINQDHGPIVNGALQNRKHVIVEYPLSLDSVEAEKLVALAQAQQKLLHVEHIELLGGLHQALREYLPLVGPIFYARYSTINPQHPAPQRWTYQAELFGFPLIAALSRLHRLIDLFGAVATVSCQSRFWQTDSEFYRACLCSAQLSFTSKVVAEVTYGKGEAFWQEERTFTVHGEQGGLIFDSEQGILVQGEVTKPIEVGSRRGLFAKDTSMVLDHLMSGTPLYVSASASLYTLKVADAARRSAATGKTILVEGC